MIFPAYFTNVNTFFPIIDEDLFMPRSEMFYTIDRSQLTVIDYCLFYLAVSIGALTEKRDSKQPDLIDLLVTASYQQAWDLVQSSFASPREESVQILLLHVSCYRRHQKPKIAEFFHRLHTIFILGHVAW